MTDSKTDTERLRELLDAAGVEWTKPKSATEHIQTTFLINGWGVEVLERYIGLCVTASNLFDTPEQAVAATLGSDAEEESECCLMYDGKKYPAELDFGFLGMMPITITVGGFRYLVEVPNGE